MIIHSITPIGMLLPPDDSPPQQTMQVDGVTLRGRRTPDGFLVSSVFSTSPSAYLDGRFAPGSCYTGMQGDPQPGSGTPKPAH